MRILKVIVIYLALIVLTLGASAYGLDRLFKDQGGIRHIATTLETIRIRTANPMMPAHRIEEEARKSIPSAKPETEKVAVVHATGTEDLTAIDRINAMNIPEEMKQQILRNYEVTGILPEIAVRPKVKSPERDPASTEF